MTTRPKVLFIAGWGRSGTTLLDNILGGHHGVFTLGELTCLWQFSFVERRRCGCGVTLLDCDLWRAVFDVAFGGSPPSAERMLALQHRAISVPRTPALLAAARSGRPDPGTAEYVDAMSRIYRAVAEVTGAQVLVDASKRPPDALATALAPGVDPYLLHMVRDPRACAHSWRRRMPEPDTATPSEMHRHGRLMNAAHWVSWNVATELIAGVHPPGHYLRVRYEDFMSAPRDTVASIFDFLDEPPAGSPFTSRDTVALPTNHTIAGNPKRFRTGPVTIRSDDEWRHAQRPLDRDVTTALSLPLLGRYRYPVATAAGQHARA